MPTTARFAQQSLLRRGTFLAVVLSLVLSGMPSRASTGESDPDASRPASRRLFSSFTRLLFGSQDESELSDDKVADDPADRVTYLHYCPTDFTMYTGEVRELIPLAYDANDEVVNGAIYTWTSSDENVVKVSGSGEAFAAGVGTATVQIGCGSALGVEVTIDVLSGSRAAITDEESDQLRASDCLVGNPYGVAPERTKVDTTAPVPTIDGGETADFSSQFAVAPYNEIGSPRFGSQEGFSKGPARVKGNLGSSNYTFAAPVLNLPGRELGIGLDLVYNSRLWTREGTASSTQMTFNYERGWPAAGWRLGYGRIIENYKGQNHLLITPDGTRIELTKIGTSGWTHKAADGSFIRFGPDPDEANRFRVQYPNGVKVLYEKTPNTNARLLPVKIITPNGNFITIQYKAHVPANPNVPNDPNAFPIRWAISQVTDTLNRNITFEYAMDGTGRLLRIKGPEAMSTAQTTIVELDYQQLTIGNAGALWASGITDQNVPVTGGQRLVWAVRRILYPRTGMGYVFSDFSTYGMAKKISTRRAMNGAGDGTEIGYVQYTYSDGGNLPDAPEFTQRTEFSVGSSSPLSPSTTGMWTYSRTTRTAFPQTTTVTEPVSGLSIVSTTEDTGKIAQVQYQGGTVSRQVTYTYDSDPQMTDTQVTDQGQTTKTHYTRGTYGRLLSAQEYNFNGTTVLRTTEYDYEDGTAYVDGKNMLYLVTQVRVKDGTTTTIARTDIGYDQYMQDYPLITRPSSVPGHSTNYDTSKKERGNVTRVTTYPQVSPPSGDIVRKTQFDILGNVTLAEVSCCQVKELAYGGAANATLHYSVPDSITSKPAAGSTPSLVTSMVYDPASGLETSETMPGGQKVTMIYDALGRATLQKLIPAGSSTAGAQVATTYASTAPVNDNLYVTQTTSYKENDFDSSFTRTLTATTWVDGAGRPVFSQAASGDKVATEYDALGRVTRRSNPYASTPQYWTNYTYDTLSRVTEVKPPDAGSANFVQIFYSTSGRNVTTEDQLNRAWKQTYDALGRVSSVTEDARTGGANLATSYTYDKLDNLTLITQGTQTRTYVYDALSRMTRETTPEEGQVDYQYTDFDAVLTRTDSRGTVATYSYDGLNRFTGIIYTTGGAQAATSPIAVTYHLSGTGNGQVSSVEQGATKEEYFYDSYGRANQNKRTIETKIYTSLYDYTTAGQLRMLTYQSGTKVQTNHDSVGRVSGLDKVTSLGGAAQHQYVSNVSYNAAWQPLGLTLGNGTSESYTYSNDRLQLTNQKVTKSGVNVMDLSYSYAATKDVAGTNGTYNAGQLAAITAGSTLNLAAADQTFTYDAYGRLSTATGKGPGAAGGSGSDTCGTYVASSGAWFLRNSNTAGGADASFTFGPTSSTLLPIKGDWDGDGDDTVGLYDPSNGTFFLKNTNAGGNADITFTFGAAGWKPIVGDWNGDGVDTIGVYDTSTGSFFLRNTNSSGTTDVTFTFGGAGIGNLPLAGDWDNDGDDTIGVYTPSTGTFFLRNANSTGTADAGQFTFGAANSTPLAGDWDNDGDDTIGVYASGTSTFFLRNSNSGGSADAGQFVFGTSGSKGLVGDWDNLPAGGTTWARRYEYDRWGNRTFVYNATVGGTSLQTATIDSARNRVTGITGLEGSATYTYDLNNGAPKVGNLTSDGVYNYQYDAANRLTKATHIGSGAVTDYLYDAANRRVRKTEGGVKTYYVWEGGQIVAEYADNGTTLLVEYMYAGSRLVASEVGSVRTYYHQDRLSTRLVTDGAGAVIGSQSHLPFGEQVSGSGTTFKRRFTTYDRDSETNTDYAVNRQHMGRLGRFTRPDTVRGSATLPQSLNRYAYANNDPINFRDPDGRIGFLVVLGTAFAGAAIGAVGSIIGQLITQGSVDPRAVGVAAGVGFVAGALAPFATAIVPAIALGASANLAQYLLTQYFTDQSVTLEGIVGSIGIGAIGGAIAGAFARAGQGVFGARFEPRAFKAGLDRVTAHAVNDAEDLAKNLGITGLARALSASIFTNTTPTPTPTPTREGRPIHPWDINSIQFLPLRSVLNAKAATSVFFTYLGNILPFTGHADCIIYSDGRFECGPVVVDQK